MAPSPSPDPATGLTVYYDGACPVCSREIGVYRRCRGADTIAWVDVSSDVFVAPCDLDRERALARFHVRRVDGELVAGAAAFRELWEQLPAWCWLARITRPAAAATLMERSYGAFLAWRSRPRSDSQAWFGLPLRVRRDLRSNHAGELGAVWIYRGMLAAARDRSVRRFALRHLATERRHLQLMRELVPPRRRSLLRPVWASAGFVAGIGAALGGANGVYTTVDAVETFVDDHYRRQLALPRSDVLGDEIRSVLLRCHTDEIAHRDEARQCAVRSHSYLTKLWTAAIARGSDAAVRLARVI